MSGNRRVSPVEKLRAVYEYMAGIGSLKTIAQKYGIGYTPFRQWIQKYQAFGESVFIKTGHNASYSVEFKKTVIEEEHEEHNYPIHTLCKFGGVSRAAYYKWLNREMSENERENQRIAAIIEKIHNESPDKGYRRIRDELERYHGIDVNDNRILRICRKFGIKSTINYP